MSLNDKVVVITGAGGGIGAAYARRCAAEGMQLVIAEINETQGRRVAEDIASSGGRCVFVRTDVADEGSCLDHRPHPQRGWRPADAGLTPVGRAAVSRPERGS